MNYSKRRKTDAKQDAYINLISFLIYYDANNKIFGLV